MTFLPNVKTFGSSRKSKLSPKSYSYKSTWLNVFIWCYFLIHVTVIRYINSLSIWFLYDKKKRKNLTLEAELIKLVLKKPGEGDLKPPAADKKFPPRDICLLQGWYDGIMEPINSKLLLWLFSFAGVGREKESSSSEKKGNS